MDLLEKFERLYHEYNLREFVDPDPLIYLYDFKNSKDREIVGLIASSLAYGRVAQILKSVNSVLKPMGASPYNFLLDSTSQSLSLTYKGFKHRFTTDKDLVIFLTGIKKTIKRFGSLNECFLHGLKKRSNLILPGYSFLSECISKDGSYLLPLPQRGSACKRLNLFLRWMVRKDNVDPGGWYGVSPSSLLIPVDTHMANIARRLGFTDKKNTSLKMAMEITDKFRELNPKDPVKYDFALTRFGIRPDLEIAQLFSI